MKIENMTSNRGNKVANQFILEFGNNSLHRIIERG